MKQTLSALAAAAALCCLAHTAHAQSQSVYIGGAYIQINSKADPLEGPSTPPDARLDVDDAKTIIFGYQRYFTDNWGIDIALGIKGDGGLALFDRSSGWLGPLF